MNCIYRDVAIIIMIGRLSKLLLVPRYQMSMLSDYLQNKQTKKQEGEFKKEMEYLANKPNFTIMDYKQRVDDELKKLKSRILCPYTQSSKPKLTIKRNSSKRVWKFRTKSWMHFLRRNSILKNLSNLKTNNRYLRLHSFQLKKSQRQWENSMNTRLCTKF